LYPIKNEGLVSNHSGEVHWCRIIIEWSNIIGYMLGSSPVRVYTTANLGQDFSNEELSIYEYKNDMDANMATLLLGELPKG
jgi:hypothetical protein